MTVKKTTTDFGYQEIPITDKAKKVADVFHSVADQYDLMNDLMSLGIHRYWKRFAIDLAAIRPTQTILDVAAGTGDLSLRIAKQIGSEGLIVVSDINEAMLQKAKTRLINQGMVNNIKYIQADAENLPFPDNFFDRIIIGFGLRNVTRKETALSSMHRTLKPGGRVIILEFSHLLFSSLKPLYDVYSFTVLPWLGKWIANDSQSYQYLAESIRMHPDQGTLKAMMQQSGFESCEYFNLSGGIVAMHRGFKA